MTERKGRERAERERRIIAAARAIAASEGWPAVTIRRLADEIEYSQPVLYAHFANRDAIVAAIAVEGFAELAGLLETAAHSPGDHRTPLRSVAFAYLGFAEAHSTLYDAMFTLPTSLRFAGADTKPEMRKAFAALVAVVPSSAQGREVAAETFWAALHGLALLERSGRIRPSAHDERVVLLVDRLFRDE
ncbi:WHG domain-containing protein [Sphingomonas sp. ASY06-1R]|uniref:TetR/AcrR family transcriptional regulator n=1 Tax=Sphingomonas sp. ASY06-1R TaxID=3445771 RepID=UPI003FA1D411